jgi:hypothetical protein
MPESSIASKRCHLSVMVRLRSYPSHGSRRKKPTATPATMKHPGGRHAERWRFIEDAALRERLKEAKGIGTPCD